MSIENVCGRSKSVRRRGGLCVVVLAYMTAAPFLGAQEPTPSTDANTTGAPTATEAKEHPGKPVIPPGVEVQSDIVYVQRGSHALKLDLYSPAGKGVRPLAIWIHGGGWIMGSKGQWVNPLFLATRGFVVASIDYRFTSEAIFPAQIQDCKAAVRFLRANAAAYGIDPGKIAVIGESAGGHLASLLGTTGGTKDFADDAADTTDDKVQAVIDLFGPADLTVFHDQDQKEHVNKLLGGSPTQYPDLARAASPVDHISPDCPPFLILHGRNDPVMPESQSEIFYAALQKAGISSELIVVPVAYHAGPAYWTKPKQDKMVAFLQQAMHVDVAQSVDAGTAK